MSFLKKIIITIVLLIVLAGIGWVGISVYANFIEPLNTSSELPEKQEAKYTVLIENTGNVLLTSKYEHTGNIYILYGFWELRGQDWQYRPTDLVLDEGIFGKITIKRR